MNSTAARFIGAARDATLDFLFPPLCINCRQPVASAGSLCGTCWQDVTFLDGPACDCCGQPFAFDPGGASLCAACHARRPAFDKARAIMRYDEASKGPILALKHADRLDLAPAFAGWLTRTGRELLEDCDMLMPVPLHRRRLWARRYNQSAEVARALARHARKPFVWDVLLRTRATLSQGEMPSAVARRRNVRGAFAVASGRKDVIAGRAVLLVDDVLTTGATVEACATALRRGGAGKVHVLALARVVRPLFSDI